MATGKLAGVDISAATVTNIYQVPDDPAVFAVATVSICNRGSVACTIQLAIGDTCPPTVTAYIEYETTLTANGVLERTGIVLAPGQYITGRSSAANVTFAVYGIETPTTV